MKDPKPRPPTQLPQPPRPAVTVFAAGAAPAPKLIAGNPTDAQQLAPSVEKDVVEKIVAKVKEL